MHGVSRRLTVGICIAQELEENRSDVDEESRGRRNLARVIVIARYITDNQDRQKFEKIRPIYRSFPPSTHNERKKCPLIIDLNSSLLPD